MFKRIAFVAYEPWETLVAHTILEQLATRDPDAKHTLIVADPYHPVNLNAWASLQEMAAGASHRTEVVFRDLLEWQQHIRRADPADVTKRLDTIAAYQKIENMPALLRSDVHLTPRERRPYYWSLSENERRASGLVVLERVIEILDAVEPHVIVMMKDQYFVKNAVAALARSRNIPVRVFRRARYQNYLKLDYFLLPLEPESAKALEAPKKMKKVRDSVSRFEKSLYPTNLAVQKADFIQLCRREPLAAAIRTLRDGWRRQRRFHRKQRKQVRVPETSTLRYWVSRSRRVRLWLAFRTARTLRYIVDRWTLARLDDVPESYILVPLHNRPEATILTRGYGIDDEDVVSSVIRALDGLTTDTVCVVLEHPSMIADRRYSFYRKLKKQGRVVFVDPTVPTQELIRNAKGLVTVSGTAGLEASLAGIPVHLAGYPEYLPAIASSGFHNIATFVEACVAGTAPVSRESVVSYIERHCYDGWEGELAVGVTRSEEALQTMVTTLIDMLKASSHEPVR